MIRMKSMGLFPRPVPPFDYYSFQSLVEKVRAIDSMWRLYLSRHPHCCAVLPNIENVIEDFEENMCRLSLDAFV